MVENLLLFIQASREGNWKLHLASLDSFVKYFFAHDLHDYARYIPIYLAEMCSLEGVTLKYCDISMLVTFL